MGKIAVHVCRWGSFLLLLVVAASSICLGQGASSPVILGSCANHEADVSSSLSGVSGITAEPACVLPSIYGSKGLTLTNVFSHYAHFLGAGQALGQTVSTAIATQLAILPIISPASGFTYKYDSGAGAFVRTTTSFGPIYTERAETIGRGKVSFGVSYQRFRFSSLDGLNLRNIPAVYNHVATTAFYGVDVVNTANSIDLNMDQTMFYGTVGVTNRFDVSLAVPVVSVRMGAISNAQIVQVSGPGFQNVPGFPGAANPNPHLFQDGTLNHVYLGNGSASGIGDVTIRLKGSVWQGQSVRVALAMDVRTPSGDARQYLGAGAIGVKPFIAVSAGQRFSPHLNVGYQYNGQSVLAGYITGISNVTVDEATGTPTIVPGATQAKLPSQILYALGADYGLTRRVTVSFDYLGQTLLNAPRVFAYNTVTADRSASPAPCVTGQPCPPANLRPVGIAAMNLKTISPGTDDVGLNSGATGVKINLFGNLLLTANVLFRLDNKGLRQDVTPLVALSYAIGGR